MSVIEHFMTQYAQEYAEYEQLAQLCARQCESRLERNGIRAMVTFRAKRLDRLRGKVVKRSQRKHYVSVKDIYQDIVDLAGVRVALYFPADKDEVNQVIQSQFIIDGYKDFPRPEPERSVTYHKRFAGYCARHYRVRLRPETLSSAEQKYANRCIEIQVGSVLMHAWAEVEHDLVYKPLTGNLSYDEYAILDELNGLIHSGEIALERLQQAVKRRILSDLASFVSHYELSAYLYDRVKQIVPSVEDPVIGRADVLFKFLQLVNLDKPAKLENYLQRLDPIEQAKPIAEQIVDRILEEDPALYDSYNNARMVVGKSDPYGKPDEAVSYFDEERALGFFMRRWVALISVARSILGPNVDESAYRGLLPEQITNILDQDMLEELNALRQVRDQVVYGMDFPAEEKLISGGRFLESVLAHIAQKLPELKGLTDKLLGKTNGYKGLV